ncbi:hypothetical protein ARMGADRAFT_1132933 [Armillaria gallica]|uniref:Uncharacterized protein n=1 Tax=Armillaria gallica TaxID=47427 RepID=A0A2H3DAG1_ARMGA|nr:hypothetical protein ARMGADRAFT_1132933 [Armillaria gallica]
MAGTLGARFCTAFRQHLSLSLYETTTMSLSTSLKLARIAADSGAPYVGNLAKVAAAIMELLEAKGKNKAATKELCESITDTIVVVDTLIKMQGETGETHFKEICLEMERYLGLIIQGLKDAQRKQHGFKGILNAPEFKATIESYGRRVDHLRIDFLLQVMGDCKIAFMEIICKQHDLMVEMHSVKATASKEAMMISAMIKRTAYYSTLALCFFAFFLLSLGDDASPCHGRIGYKHIPPMPPD